MAFAFFHAASQPNSNRVGARLLYSIELLVKCHRLGWRIGEVPARWFERAHGASRFQVVKWLPDYLRWYRYAFATSYLRRPAETVRRQPVT